MGNVTPFKQEMQPARPYPPEIQTSDSIIYAQAQTIKELQQAIKGLAKPSDPREQDVLARTGELGILPAPQHASTYLDDQWHRQDGIAALTILVDTYGLFAVRSWLRNIAAMTGETL